MLTTKEFRSLFEKYYEFAKKVAVENVDNVSLADDICQEVFEKLYKIGDTLELSNEQMLRSLIFVMTKRKSIDFMRKQKKLQEECPLEMETDPPCWKDNPELIILYQEMLAICKKVFTEMREQNREDYEIIHKTILEDGVHKEIAREYGITSNTLNNRILRAKRRLQNILSVHYQE